MQSGQPTCELEKRVNLRYGHLTDHWRINTINGQSVTPVTAKVFNDLEVLDKTYVVTNITVWHDTQRLVGIQLLYQNGQTILHGIKDASYKVSTFNIDSGRKTNPESINLVWLEAHADDNEQAWVDTIRVVTPADLFIVESPERLKKEVAREEEKQVVIRKSELWITGSLVDRGDSMWAEEFASASPALQAKSSGDWTIRGFMGQAGSDGIETVAVVWGKV